jgi:hypothetical protein
MLIIEFNRKMYLNMTSNKMKLGIAMMLIASLSAALLSIPSNVAKAQTSPADQTMLRLIQQQRDIITSEDTKPAITGGAESTT